MQASHSALVGFTGSRKLPSAEGAFVQQVVRAVVRAGRGVAVGCAAGADFHVRQAAGSAAHVFAAAEFKAAGIPARGALAQRSAALVAAVAAAGRGSALIGFVGSSCPARLIPSSSASSCFSGKQSGTWATLALAAGSGVPVFVFATSTRVHLPAWPGGSWQAVGGRGVWARAWRWVPLVQSPLS